MLLTIFQEGGTSGPSMEELMPMIYTAITILVFVFYGLEVLFLKLGLKVTKAPGKTGIKWVMGSVAIQIGLMFFIAVPFILIGFSTGFGSSSSLGPMIGGTISLLIFLWVNTINVLHRPGLKRSVLVFLLMLVPIIIVMTVGVGAVSWIFSNAMGTGGVNGGTV